MECTDKYDFDTPIDRTNTQSLKWDVAENELPMWVADMDFKTAPEIIEAVNKRAAHGVFGYSIQRLLLLTGHCFPFWLT